MICQYTVNEANAWAHFSGDYNPIHFSVEHARSMESEHIVVHGMRAMLDMKRSLSESLLSRLPIGDFFRFSARLRKPMHCDRPYLLCVSEAGGRFNGKMLDMHDDSECFSARLFPAMQPSKTLPPRADSRCVSSTEALKELFPGCADTPEEYWSFWDALLFQRLLAAPELPLAINAVEPAFKATSSEAVFSRFPVVQTHHEVLFSVELLSPKPELSMHYAILPIHIVGNKDSGLIMRAEIQAWGRKQQLLISTAITLKTWPMNRTKH
ncbi:MaoC family dehydratase [Buttiauxella noackiae]|uniref:MaoC family dehydratase n=1 Tax=Buttiauxella noackiae TaxID=82992 RepID=UPI0035A59743